MPAVCLAVMVQVMINLLSAAIMETSKGYVRVRLSAEMVFPHHDEEDAPDIGDGSESRSVSISEDGSEDVLFGEGGQHLHGPQLHLVITVDSTGTSQAALTAENTIAIQTPRKVQYCTVTVLSQYCALYCAVQRWRFVALLSVRVGVRWAGTLATPSIAEHFRDFRDTTPTDVQHCTLLYCTILHCTALCCALLTVLYCSVLYCKEVYCLLRGVQLLPLLGGTLGTMIDPKRGAIYTARIPVNSHHPEYKGAMAMRAAKPLQIRDPLLHTRVLVVGSTQVYKGPPRLSARSVCMLGATSAVC